MRSSKGRVLLGVLVSLCLPVVASAARGKTPPPKPTAAQGRTPPTKPTAAQGKIRPAKLTAAQIVQKHVAARGGLKAWRAVQSMAWNGKMDVGHGDSVARSKRYVSDALARRGRGPRTPPPDEGKGKGDALKQVQAPFVLELKRPARSRMESSSPARPRSRSTTARTAGCCART